jgi:hypothetical protein
MTERNTVRVCPQPADGRLVFATGATAAHYAPRLRRPRAAPKVHGRPHALQSRGRKLGGRRSGGGGQLHDRRAWDERLIAVRLRGGRLDWRAAAAPLL